MAFSLNHTLFDRGKAFKDTSSLPKEKNVIVPKPIPKGPAIFRKFSLGAQDATVDKPAEKQRLAE